jgi:cytoskeletal protein CcmA (bactofilin family)
MVSASDIRIDGKFTGKICTKGKLVVGEKALIDGVIVCNSADVWGEVKGDIFVESSLSLKAKSVYTGAVKSSKIGIEMGAIFNGTCNIIGGEEFKKYSLEFFPAAAPKPAAEIKK